MSTPQTAGPNGDGSKSLARESWVGQFVNGAAVVLVLSLATALGQIDFTPLPDYIEGIAVAAASTAAGLLAAWATKNRRAFPASSRFERG